MRGFIASLVGVVLVVSVFGVAESLADVLYSDNFESYAATSAIDGQGSWITSGASVQWLVAEWNPIGGQPPSSSGKWLSQGRGWPNPGPNADYAILHLSSQNGFQGLGVNFNYLLQLNETAKIDISPNNTVWTDVTSSFALVKDDESQDCISRFANANLTSQATQAGIQNDLYVRFMA